MPDHAGREEHLSKKLSDIWITSGDQIPAGGYVICGTWGDTSIILVKLSDRLEIEWRRSYDVRTKGQVVFADVRVAEDGGFFVLFRNLFHRGLLKTDSAGLMAR